MIHGEAHRDTITGEPDAHPVDVGLATAVGGAASAAGPAGTVAGAMAGGIAGGYACKGIAESIDPTAEDADWRENYANRADYDQSHSYDVDYAPAYRYGWESRGHYHDRTWDEVETDLERGWESARANSRLTWEKARYAIRDAWDRVTRWFSGSRSSEKAVHARR